MSLVPSVTLAALERFEAAVCSRCDDTHRMDMNGTTFMCTHCPLPCQKCRQGGTGAYCESTPCSCVCHQVSL